MGKEKRASHPSDSGAKVKGSDLKRRTQIASVTRQDEVHLNLQQLCLETARRALQPRRDVDEATLQVIKGHLYNRDFAAAFGTPEHLRVYAARWSPSRALGYLDLLVDMQEHILRTADETRTPESQELNVTCIGGGAGAEILALAGWIDRLERRGRTVKVQAKCLDIAAWADIVSRLYQAVTTQPETSQFSSTAVKEASAPLVSKTQYGVEFEQVDILSKVKVGDMPVFHHSDLITLMFTLNELYTCSVSKTQQMLTMLTLSVRPGTHLLVVDSPGSYSTVSINGMEKKYPMQWLLDYTLLGGQRAGETAAGKEGPWEKVAEDESRWFRLASGLDYPIDLENMRYQMHLYKRLPSPR